MPIAPSCSLLHTPFDLDLETDINPEIKNWMAFAKQKLNEIKELGLIISGDKSLLEQNSDAIQNRKSMDADVITIETSRSQMELLEAFSDFKYPNEIGPGVYDIHSPRVPNVNEMVALLNKASSLLPAKNIWVNPDCGLKTRKWLETEQSLKNMVTAAAEARGKIGANITA